MEKICPTCNSISQVSFPCHLCGGRMKDKGRVAEYFGSYSAEMPIENNDIYCEHIFECDECGELKNYTIKMINA